MSKLAKPTKGEYKRNLPHIQADDKAQFVTFATFKRWERSVRGLVLRHCLHDHGVKIQMHGAVVMPDHVHLVFAQLRDELGNIFGLAEIMNGIKGASSHSVNKALKRSGPVWQYESFDRILRSEENILQKAEYLCQNPVRKGLVDSEDDYPWLWREWLEGVKDL